ncbi:PilW family protein [Synechococcus sp. GFB01]|uniref:PilW family protein n=1 Tax=Synechococcus sp. GFB01 TaxID=1662190 RepID=UPI00069FB3BB|nr:prepilin-type N-terminal cleavage/methylation domain-containing protein [Synechococcus sp. GFB01]
MRRNGGFTLVELLVTLALSGLVIAVVLQLMVGDLQHVGRLGRWLRERQAGERALELVRGELQRAERGGPPLRGDGAARRLQPGGPQLRAAAPGAHRFRPEC